MEDNRISYHNSVQTAYKRIQEDGLTNIWDRFEAQGLGDPDKRCAFCMGGVRCDFCSNGPCRADAAKDKRGVCGITADGMAMRMMLLRNVMGASTYQYHAAATVRTLRKTAEGKTPYSLKEPEKLKSFADRLKVDSSGSLQDIAIRICDFVEKEWHISGHEESAIVTSLAPVERQQLWRNLGIFPGGIFSEMMMATSSSLTNVDGYYVSLAKKAMRMSIAMAYQTQIVLEYLQDVMFGIPRPHVFRTDLGVLDPDYVNILPNGHEPFMGFALVKCARGVEWQEKAKKAGAKGIHIIANIETGQEMIQRWEMDDVFYGYTGNWIMQEAVFATGAVDVFVADMNCSMPIDPIYARKYQFRLLPVSDLVAFEGIEERLNYIPEDVKSQAAKILEIPIPVPLQQMRTNFHRH